MDYQLELDLLFDLVKIGEITEIEYGRRIDELASEFPSEVLNKLRWRKDGRSLGEFASTILKQTRHERKLMALCFKYFADMGDNYIDCGVDNDGKLVIDVGTKGQSPDFEVCRWDGTSYFVEIKPAPHDKFFTYKVDNLSSYIDAVDVSLLTVVGSGSFMLLDRDGMSNILKYGEYDRHNGFGGKPTVRIYNKMFDQIGELVTITEDFSHGSH